MSFLSPSLHAHDHGAAVHEHFLSEVQEGLILIPYMKA